MRRRNLLLLALALAAPLGAAEDGGQPTAWAKLALGARPAALGQAVSALPDDPGAALLNPALAATQLQANLGSQAAFLPDGSQLHYVGLARPLWNDSRFAWSLAYAQYQVDQPFERRRGNTGDPDSTFRESASLSQLGLAGWLLEQRLALGLDVKVYSHALADANGGGVSGDLGLYWRCRPWLDLGVATRDVASKLGWSTGAGESLPARLRLAARGSWGERGSLGLEFDGSQLQAARLRAGLEFWAWRQLLALRAGFDGAGWTSGLGLRWPWLGFQCGLDYALASDPIGSDALQHRVSVQLGVPL